MENNIQKAHAVGDQHPNKPWVWTLLSSGKYDWRPIKGATTSKVTPMSNDKLVDWAKQTTEANLTKVANAPNGKAIMRKIAYDELVARGYDVSTINTAGSLSTLMNMVRKTPTAVAAQATSDDDTAEVDIPVIDDDEIKEKWYLNSEDDRVKKMFNMKTKDGRVKYDHFLDKMKRKEKDYLNPIEVVEDLNEQYVEFLDNDEQRFMISAGGAGIGKTYGFTKLAELMSKKPYSSGDEPGGDGYDYYEATNVASGKQLLNILKAHNGKIILFDDTDSILTLKQCAPVMKKACSTTGIRMVGDPDDVKTNFEFTGRIMIMTNKNLNALAMENEDARAVISRAMMKSDIHMTVAETIEVMKNRFQSYEFTESPRLPDPVEDAKERNDLLDLIEKNKKNIDPAQFTTRSFQEILNEKRKVEKANEKRKNPMFAALIGSVDKKWEDKALAVLTKGSEDELEKGDDEISTIEKAFDGDITFEDMSIEKAEQLLFEE